MIVSWLVKKSLRAFLFQDELEIEIAELEKAVTGYEQSQKSAEKFIALIDKYENFDTLTNTIHKQPVGRI